MKCFICSLDSVNRSSVSCLGIPSEYIEKIIPADMAGSSLSGANEKWDLVSVPMLLNLKDIPAIHALVLKASDPVKTALLTTKIDEELEIPQEHIKQLPEVLAESLDFFKGVYFTGQRLILILEPSKLKAGRLTRNFAEGEGRG